MTASANEAILREYFAAVQSGDRSVFDRILAEDIEYHFPGRSPFATTHRSRAEVYGYLDRLGAETGGTMSITVEKVFADEDTGVAIVRPKATRKGRELEWPLVIVFRFADGRISKIRLHYGDQHEMDEFLTF